MLRAPLRASEPADRDARVRGNHLGQDIQHGLRHRLVVDGDQVRRLRVHLQSLVEAQRGFDLVGS